MNEKYIVYWLKISRCIDVMKNIKKNGKRDFGVFRRRKKYLLMWSMALTFLFAIGCEERITDLSGQADSTQNMIVEGELDLNNKNQDTYVAERNDGLVEDEVLTLTTADGRSLSVKLYLSPAQHERWFSVTQLQVIEGETLIQNIDSSKIAQKYDVGGLYLLRGYNLGDVDVRDFNFDGSQDFALLVEDYLPRCPAALFFLWDEKENKFVDSFIMTSHPDLDEEKQQIIEWWIDGVRRNYTIQDGKLIAGEQWQIQWYEGG